MHSLFWGQNYAAIHHCANSKNAICTSPPSIARFQEGRMEKNQPWNICTEGSEKMEDEEGAYGSRGRGRGRSCGASRRSWGWRSPRGGGARRRPRRRPGGGAAAAGVAQHAAGQDGEAVGDREAEVVHLALSASLPPSLLPDLAPPRRWDLESSFFSLSDSLSQSLSYSLSLIFG